MKNYELGDKFEVGPDIRIGKEYASIWGRKEGDVITLETCYFEEDNGLYCTDVPCLGIMEYSYFSGEKIEDPSSIYHLFGNELENFMDCELLTPNKNKEEE